MEGADEFTELCQHPIVYRVALLIVRSNISVFSPKMGQPRPLFCLFLVFSSKQYNFYNKSM